MSLNGPNVETELSEYDVKVNELMSEFQQLGIEPKTIKSNKWFGDANQRYIDDLSRELTTKRIESQALTGSKIWKENISDVEKSLLEKCEQALNSLNFKDKITSDEYNQWEEEVNESLDKKEKDLLNHSIFKSPSLAETDNCKTVTDFRKSEASKFEYSRNPFAKALLNNYNHIAKRVNENIDKVEEKAAQDTLTVRNKIRSFR